MAVLTPAPKMQFFDINGEPLVGGKVYTYEAGTTTPLDTYADNTGASVNPNPVVLNARGEASIWLGGGIYKFRLTDANEVEVWTVDYVSAPISAVSPALSGNIVIDSNSSNPALKITQTGFGLALRVQDSADPDATPFAIDSNGYVGLGTAAPAEALDIANSGKIRFSLAGAARATVSVDASDFLVDVNDDRNVVFKTNGVTVLTINDNLATSTVPIALPGNPTSALQAAPKQYVDQAAPAGAVMAFAMNAAPTGWLAANGDAVSRTTYAALFAAIGTTFGAGDGSTTFNVPDLRGYFVRGYGTNSDGTTSGAFGAKQSDDNKAHTHTVNDPGHIHTGTTIVSGSNSYQAGGNFAYNSSTGGGSTLSATTGITLVSSGSESRPKNIALLYCIKT